MVLSTQLQPITEMSVSKHSTVLLLAIKLATTENEKLRHHRHHQQQSTASQLQEKLQFNRHAIG